MVKVSNVPPESTDEIRVGRTMNRLQIVRTRSCDKQKSLVRSYMGPDDEASGYQ